MPFNAWKLPYHLWTSRQMMIWSSVDAFMNESPVDYRLPTPSAASSRLLVYDMASVKDPVDNSTKEIDFNLPPKSGLGEYAARRTQQIRQADDHDQRGVFEQADELAHRRRMSAQGLRQDNQHGRQKSVDAQSLRRLQSGRAGSLASRRADSRLERLR